MSDRPKWTPGPWHVGTHPKHAPYVADANGDYVASLDDRSMREDPRFRPDLDLIAAAPDLYRELEASATARLPDGTPCWCYIGPVQFSPERHSEECAGRRAALAKARGE